MPFGNLGFTEIAGLLILGLLVFGAKRLPEIGSSMGKGIREFKRSLSDVGNAVSEPAEPRVERSALREPLASQTDDRASEPKRLIG